MKIIELLNKIANGEEVPKKIKCFNYNFIYTEDKRPQRFYKLENQDNYLLKDFVYTLNTRVEIIEDEPRDIEVCGSLFTRSEYNKLAGIKEDKKIEKIDLSEWGEIVYKENWEMLAKDFNRNCNLFVDKINEIIDYLEENK